MTNPDPGRVGVVGPDKRSDFEMKLQPGPLREFQGAQKAPVRDGPSHEACGQGQIHSLLTVGPGIGTVRIKGEGRGPRLVPEQGAGGPPDVVGARGMRARRAVHDGTEHVVEDADEFHNRSTRHCSRMWSDRQSPPAVLPSSEPVEEIVTLVVDNDEGRKILDRD